MASAKDFIHHSNFVPQLPGAKYPINHANPESPFYVPWTDPPTGTAISEPKPLLLTPLKLRGVEFKNRIWVSPMCQYSAPSGTGMPTDWHLVHQGQFAIRGLGLVFTEATAVLPNGMISPEDLGIWSDEHIPAFKRIVNFHHSQGTLAALQLAHAGRKASTYAPWLTDALLGEPPIKVDSRHVPKEANGWTDVWGPSALSFSAQYPMPSEMTLAQIEEVKSAFVAGTKRALKAGYDVIEIHGAHGYLVHEFLSPISNHRTDKYGGSLENRLRFALEVTQAVRATWPDDKPLFFRVSASDWDERGEKDEQGRYISWGLEQTRALAKQLLAIGVDLIDTSSGGLFGEQKIAVGPGYQVHFAKGLKDDPELEGLAISSVGLITDPHQAEEILQSGQADAVMLARELLRNSDFVTRTAHDLGAKVMVDVQYERAFTRMYQPKK